MVSKKSKVTIINNLYSAFADNLRSIYNVPINNLTTKITGSRKEVCRAYMKEIEEEILKEYPELEKSLRCDYSHSSYDSSTITLVFKLDPDTADIKMLLDEQQKLQEKYDRKRAELDRWRTDALVANMMEEGMPVFDPEA